MNLWGDHDSRLRREMWIFISNDDRGRGDLLHCRLRWSPLGRRERIVVPAATAAADHFRGSRQSVRIRRWGNQRHNLPRYNSADDLMTERSAGQEQADQRNVHDGGYRDTIGAIIVVLPP